MADNIHAPGRPILPDHGVRARHVATEHRDAVLVVETDPQSPFRAPEEPAAEWIWRAWLDRALERGATYMQAICARAGFVPTFPTRPSQEQVVYAFVNHGRWMWQCECGAAQTAADQDHRAFCVECFNHGDGWWPVIFPARRTDIETLLVRRPYLHQRNWDWGESLEQLQLENVSHGIDPDLPDLILPAGQAAAQLVARRRVLTPSK